MNARVEWPVQGRFSLAESIAFGFGHTTPGQGEVMRLAFVQDGYDAQVGVAVTQPAPDLLVFEVVGEGDPERAAAQAARILSVDVDATGFDSLVAGDPVLDRVVARRPGLRPVSFHSAYEALLWAILSARRPAAQMAVVRSELARLHGRVFEVAGKPVPAMATPRQLLAVDSFSGIPEIKLGRMKAVAETAAAGELDTATLRAADPDDVERRLQEFAGIGPFYSQLVTVRALGHTDVLATAEPRVVAATGALLGRPDLDQAGFAEAADAWRPWRTWASVAVRAGG
jgi:DNA-3-methyladenine glycosylase II